jgi:hypothetical protein
MKETVKVLMSRDGLTQAEAVKQVKDFFLAMQEDIQSGGDPFPGKTILFKSLVLSLTTLKILFFRLQLFNNSTIILL